MKPRINIVCRGSDYKNSINKYKQLREEYIKCEHIKNADIIQEISSHIVIDNNRLTVTQHKQAYIRVFGNLLPITQEEVNNLPSNITIIWE